MVDNFRPGYLNRGAPLGATRKQVMLIADNTQIDCAGISYLELMSDSATAANRTFTLVGSTLLGQELKLVFVSALSNTCQLANSGTCKLSAVWEPLQYEGLDLMWNGSYWIEMGRQVAVNPDDIPLADGHILVGSSGGIATDVALTGDIAITNAGVSSIASGVIVDADVNASAAIAFSKLATLTSTNILLGSAGNVATSTAVTGDVTIGNTGVTAIGSAKVTLAKLAAGVAPAYVSKYGGVFNTVGGDAAESIPVSGAVAGDIAIVTVKTAGISPASIVAAAATTDAITVTMSADPSTDHVLQYQVFRAAT